MRVLMTADTVGGVFTWATELAGALRRRGIEVVLASFGPAPNGGHRERVRGAGEIEWRHRELALEWMPDPWRDLSLAGHWLLALEREVRPDLGHLSGFGHAVEPFEAPVVVTAHSDVVSWWRAVRGGGPPSGWDRYRCWVNDGLGACDALVAPTCAALLDLLRGYEGRPARSRVIANGSSARPGAADRRREPTVLAAGRLWDAAKGLDVLVAAACALPSGTVRVAGDLGDRRAPDGVTVLGPLAPRALAAERRRASVFAAPARYEPFGLSTLEAARDGCALVLGDIPSQRELWDGVATFVAPGDADALDVALRGLLDDPQRVAALGGRARERSHRYGIDAAARAHADLYRELIAGGAVIADRSPVAATEMVSAA